MPTRDEIKAIADLLVETMQKASEVKERVLLGDQDFYTKQTADFAQAAHDTLGEALSFLSLTQAGVPLESRTAPGYRPPMSTKIRGGVAGGPSGQPRLRGSSVRLPTRGRGR